jgi:C-terminal processing protease CtpA/Prc
MILDYSAEKAYIFDHSWRQFKQKLVFPDLQKVDWDFYYTTYRKFLPHINNNYDFAEMLSEMLGEMNVSHTGCYYRPNVPNSDATASLGLLYDYGYTGDGVRVAEVLQGGPVDLAASTIKPGHVIEAIDGNRIDAAMDFYKLLNRKAGKFTLLAVHDPASDKRWDETVKPVDGAEDGELLYRRWVRRRWPLLPWHPERLRGAVVTAAEPIDDLSAAFRGGRLADARDRSARPAMRAHGEAC